MSTAFKSIFANGDFIRVHVGPEELGNAIVNSNSIVLASITETTVVNGIIVQFVGDATMEVHNIAVSDPLPGEPNGHIDMIVAIFWDSPLNALISLVIFP